MKSSKPNVSILITSFTSGGAEKVISLLLKPMLNDFNVTLVLFYNEKHFNIPKGVDLVLLSEEEPSQGIISKFKDLAKFKKAYQELLIAKQIDYSISFLAFPNLINGLLSTKNRKFKTLLSERGFPSDNTTSKISKLISKIGYPILYNKCDRLFSNSIFINEDLAENFGVKIPMEVIYNPIEIPENTIVPSSLNKELIPLKLITVGSVDKRKNQIMVIRALKELDDKAIEFSIFGAGPLENYVAEEINQLELATHVFLKGRTKEVNTELSKSHLFILSSFTEGFPNALMEGMAAGLPCISTNCLSGPLEMLNQNQEVNIKNGEFVLAKYGILVNTDDHVGLAKAIKFFKENPDERQKYSKLSLERAKDYDLNSIYSEFKNFIEKN
ncbi:N-acetylgalactosamine-N,N'-diacetylbacillosaminyl-diphospho-undecaprenol 4-alpha-N-acetylgalactosaminyltransferase [Croceivirga lutea]|uniref:glycosyltransferase n=1 Tax=Croceivirga lutea TaxID=1775167 RepID=UPI001639CCC8|nr:glycosyltransferase [Croceivirga lutea]GGG42630.1 N-acetylgalactosamine-N,N'-diacetylbacillosaminyl-diphospho-undecaprenol 4-alpha-N-acetylgalactosaminyltransferase [Croceivirga lutea]